jgi:hypothetical protein
MAAVGFYIANGLGDSIDAPSAVQMEQFLRDIDATDEEHGAAWLSTDEGYSLEWNGDGRLAFTRPDTDEVWHVRDVSRDRALALWMALAEGKVADVERGAWQRGNGYVVTPERQEQLRAWRHQQDREFYETLGEERASVPCRADGCKRGAVEFSVLCRVHHFESVQKRPCPFHD